MLVSFLSCHIINRMEVTLFYGATFHLFMLLCCDLISSFKCTLTIRQTSIFLLDWHIVYVESTLSILIPFIDSAILKILTLHRSITFIERNRIIGLSIAI